MIDTRVQRGPSEPVRGGRVGGFTSAGLMWGALGALGVSVAAMVGLHLAAAGRLDPVTTTVSDYASMPGGAVPLAFAVLAVAVAAFLAPAALAGAGLPDPAPVCVLCWLGCLGLVGSVVFPTNAPDTAASVVAVLHRYAAGLFFVSLPFAARAAYRRLAGSAVALRRLTLLGVVAGCAFLLSHLPLVAPGFPANHLISVVDPRGLAERVLLAVDLGVLAALGLAARRVPV